MKIEYWKWVTTDLLWLSWVRLIYFLCLKDKCHLLSEIQYFGNCYVIYFVFSLVFYLGQNYGGLNQSCYHIFKMRPDRVCVSVYMCVCVHTVTSYPTLLGTRGFLSCRNFMQKPDGHRWTVRVGHPDDVYVIQLLWVSPLRWMLYIYLTFVH